MIEIKKVGIESIPAIQKIAYETWPNTFGKVMPSEQIDYMLGLIYNESALKNQMIDKRHQFVLAEEAGDPLGFTSYELHYKSEPQLMIHKIYLLPQTQGLGIGTKLLNLLSDIALQNKIQRLRLKVFYKNDKAIHFYEKYGFSKKGTETTDIGNNYEILDYVMIKELAS